MKENKRLMGRREVLSYLGMAGAAVMLGGTAAYGAESMTEEEGDNELRKLQHSLASGTGASGIGYGAETVQETLDRIQKRTIIDAREFGLSIGSINDTATLINAIQECYNNGLTLGVSGVLDFGDAELVIDTPCDIWGSGWFKDLRFIIGGATNGDLWARIDGIGVISSAAGGDHGFVVRKGRFLDFLNIRARLVDTVIRGESYTNTGRHTVGLITIDNLNALDVGSMVKLIKQGGDLYAFNDIKIQNSRGWFLRDYGTYIEQIDGLVYADNYTHFGRNMPTSKNHLRVQDAEWLNIGGTNTMFEGGEEAVYISEVGQLAIGGSTLIGLTGQNRPASALKIANSSKFLSASIADGAIKFEKPSLHGIEISSPSGMIHMGTTQGAIDARIGSNASPSYFGTTDLSTIEHYGVSISGGVAAYGECQSDGLFINGGGVSSKLKDRNESTALRTNMKKLGNRAAVASVTVTATVPENTGTTLIGPTDMSTISGHTPTGAEIFVQAYNADGSKVAVYHLLYRRASATVAEVKTVSFSEEASIIDGTPAFSWGTSSSGSLQIFPKSKTGGGGTVTGSFTFIISSIGGVTFGTR
ncbi:hypothetical protein [Paenibacillus agaridevorans]|uniref:hypothetical protein n=1 Tax=Paenibacillus agaridevorans TaxID=171404 RepID=UPI001BE4AB60|nr:hypothetical protein [Paenibacillus agaridevorans]